MSDVVSPVAPSQQPDQLESPALDFWRERHLCTLATVRPDGTPHVVPVGVTYDPDTGLARIITNRTSVKARAIAAAGTAAVALTQVDGRRWTTLEGRARVVTDPTAIADAVERCAVRYKQPRPNPDRVVIEVEVQRVLGTMRVPLPATD